MQEMIKNISDYSILVLTGGSSGIGSSFADCFSRVNPKGVICNLSRTKILLSQSFYECHHYSCDLSDSQQVISSVGQVLERIKTYPDDAKLLLINNSGFGSYGPFDEANLAHELNMVDVNVKGMMQVTGLLLPELIRRKGAVINIASTAAFQPTPYMATYGASKAFVLNWSLALNQDLKDKGVHVMAVCPGPTKSNFFKRAGFDEAPLNPGMGQTAEQVVQCAFKALLKRRSLVVSGWQNRLLTRAVFFLPKRVQAVVSRIVLKKMRLDSFKKK